MTVNRLLTPVPAVPPRPPALTLINAAIQPEDTTDGRWTGGFTYAPENRFAAERREVCDEVTLDVPAIPAPTGLVATPVPGGGTLSAGVKTYEITYVNHNGETTPSTAATCTVVANGQATLTFPHAPELATTVNVYGRVGGSLGLLATGVTGTTWTDTGAATVGAAPPSSNTTGGPGNYTNQGTVSYVPWLAVVEDECSAFGFEARDFVGRATRLLDNATEQALTAEFWTGALATAAALPNNFLTNASSVTDLTPGSGAVSITRGMQILEDALAQTGFGGQGMIHTMPETAPNFLGARRVGAQLLSVMDNLIVPGVGYAGTAPGGTAPTTGTAYMYATDLVSVRLDDIKVFPDSFEEALDRGNAGEPNTITFRAERFCAASFDAFAHFAVKVTLTT